MDSTIEGAITCVAKLKKYAIASNPIHLEVASKLSLFIRLITRLPGYHGNPPVTSKIMIFWELLVTGKQLRWGKLVTAGNR